MTIADLSTVNTFLSKTMAEVESQKLYLQYFYDTDIE